MAEGGTITISEVGPGVVAGTYDNLEFSAGTVSGAFRADNTGATTSISLYGTWGTETFAEPMTSTWGGFVVERSREIDILYLDTDSEIGVEIEAYGLVQGNTYPLGKDVPGGVPMELSIWKIGTENEGEAEATSGDLTVDLLSDSALVGSFSGMFGASEITGSFNVSLLARIP